jgi:hypothetical protein
VSDTVTEVPLLGPEVVLDDDSSYSTHHADGNAPTPDDGQPAGPPQGPDPRPASQRSSREARTQSQTPGVGSNPDMLYADDMYAHLDRAETADRQRLQLLEQQQLTQATQTQMLDLQAQMAVTATERAAEVAAHATQLAEQAAAHQRVLGNQQAQRQAAHLSLERERERVGEQRGLLIEAEAALKREKERSAAVKQDS